ncbi:cysteine proteinase inhibitor 1-like [Hevea brasiliensis]|uniref:cysteine proteinase inhibitor 1-like n=1 Tax=Hevea brasiliensis TaxID=3981 RepID=UPI0025FA133B|nr:cysteine proteinase inhibitor 1-like [Hevea brasiliensis]
MAGSGEYEPVDPNSPKIQSLAHFVVYDYNDAKGTHLVLLKVLKAETQVVDGTNYRLTLEVRNGVLIEVYETIIYVKVEEFKRIVPP